jgi:hypothetical protein
MKEDEEVKTIIKISKCSCCIIQIEDMLVVKVAAQDPDGWLAGWLETGLPYIQEQEAKIDDEVLERNLSDQQEIGQLVEDQEKEIMSTDRIKEPDEQIQNKMSASSLKI